MGRRGGVDILCHRGLWTERSEHNTLGAFRAAWARGWGLELDVRDLDGVPVVSHDPPRHGAGALTLQELLTAYAAAGRGTTLAVNVKSDGLAVPVTAALEAAAAAYFVFDMSVPDTLHWLRAGATTYTRWSDVEPEPLLLEQCAGVWLDAFHADGWWSEQDVRSLLADGARVAVVSPELHGRVPLPVWARLVGTGLAAEPGLSLCTDLPDRWTSALEAAA